MVAADAVAALFLLATAAEDGPSSGGETSPVVQEPSPWSLVWFDEFEGEVLDRSRWSFDVDCWGGGNSERQCFTDAPENARVVDGALVITARRETVSGPSLPDRLRSPGTPIETVSRDFSSARLVSRGHAAWRYGRIEVRARLPRGQGLWPAIWMLPEHPAYGGWASSGEIDIMEAVNLGAPCEECLSGIEDRVFGTLHYGGQWPDNRHSGTKTTLPDRALGTHTFALEWSEHGITWFVDDMPYACQRSEQWFTSSPAAAGRPAAPFDQPFHLILNVAVGGRLPEGGNSGGVDPAIFPQSMIVEFVRVYEWAGEGVAPGPVGACEPAYHGAIPLMSG